MKKVIRLSESELTKLVKRIVNEQMEDDSLSDHIKIYHMYKNGELDKKTFYSFIGILDRRDKERLLDYINGQKEDMLDESEDEIMLSMENDLRSDIENLLYNSNASNDEIISILRQIADEREESRRVRHNTKSRFQQP